jgi:hypothetical protein
MTTTTHTMVVKLSHELVVSRGNDLIVSPCSLLHIIENSTCHCMRRHMGLLTCTNVFDLTGSRSRILRLEKTARSRTCCVAGR